MQILKAYTENCSSFFNELDYYPFGMVLPGRNGSVSDYRYGFMGYEGDPEIKGEGNSYTTEFRQYDPRIGRWLSIDPVFKHHESPYAAYANNPIWFGDPNGGDTLVMHRSAPIQSYTDYDQTALIYVITFSVIRNGVEEHLDQQMYMIGSAHAAKTGDNGLIKYDYYTLTWQRMENHPNFENTIKMTDNGDGQFIHQGNWGNDFAGCAGVSSSEPELTTYSGDPFVKIINTVDALQDVKDLYNTVNGTDNSLTGDKFILKTDSESHAPQTPKAGEVETLPTSKTATENTQNTEATAPTGHQSKRDEGSAVRAGR